MYSTLVSVSFCKRSIQACIVAANGVSPIKARISCAFSCKSSNDWPWQVHRRFFTVPKRRKSLSVISGEYGGWDILWTCFRWCNGLIFRVMRSGLVHMEMNSLYYVTWSGKTAFVKCGMIISQKYVPSSMPWSGGYSSTSGPAVDQKVVSVYFSVLIFHETFSRTFSPSNLHIRFREYLTKNLYTSKDAKRYSALSLESPDSASNTNLLYTAVREFVVTCDFDPYRT
jgi:hypothetical protein